MQSPDYTYGNDYKLIDSKSSEVNEPFNKMIVMNPELKNLNLKAVENIVLQKLINQKMYNSENNFMNLRKVKQRNRIKTAGWVWFFILMFRNVSEFVTRPKITSRFKPLSAQASFVGMFTLSNISY